MTNQNLFLPVCGSLIVLFVIVVAMIGMRSRLRFGNRLLNAYKDKKRVEDWRETQGKNKQKLLLLSALVSIIGILALFLLVLANILQMSNLLLLIFVALIFLCIISGILILIDLEKLAK